MGAIVVKYGVVTYQSLVALLRTGPHVVLDRFVHVVLLVINSISGAEAQCVKPESASLVLRMRA